MCPTIIQQQTRLLKISWILLLASGIGILGFGIIVTAYPQIGVIRKRLTESYWCSNNWNGNIWYHDYSGGFQKKGKMGMVYSLVLSYFLDNTLVGELPPGNDHIHQIVFIVISLLGLLLPVRQLFSRNMVKS